MTYVLTLIALLSVFLWATPAREYLDDHVRNGLLATESLVASGSMTLKARLNASTTTVRQKSFRLIRDQLHRSIEGLVR